MVFNLEIHVDMGENEKHALAIESHKFPELLHGGDNK
jgi:hypothetical protein